MPSLRFSKKQSTKISPKFITNMNNRLTYMESRMDECCDKKSSTTDSFNSADDGYDLAPSGSWWVHIGLQGMSLNKRPIKYLKSKTRYDYALNNENKRYGPKIGYEFEIEEVINDDGEFLTVKMNGKILYLPKKIGTEDVLKYTFPVGKGIIPVGKGKKTEKIKKKKKTKRKRKSKRKSKGKANEKKAKKQRKSKRKSKRKKRKREKTNGKKKQKIK